MGALTLDRFAVVSFLRDSDFSDPHRLYLNRKSGGLVEVYEGAFCGEFATEAENRAARHRVEEAPLQFLEIPIPDHGQYHTWFQEFLETTGRDGYFGSIGGWFKEHGSEEDKLEWQDFVARQVADYFIDVCKAEGVIVALK